MMTHFWSTINFDRGSVISYMVKSCYLPTVVALDSYKWLHNDIRPTISIRVILPFVTATVKGHNCMDTTHSLLVQGELEDPKVKLCFFF